MEKKLNSIEMTDEILKFLSIYEKAGVVTRDNLGNVPPEYHPKNIMSDFQSIIVLARIPEEIVKENIPDKFKKTIGIVYAQDNIIRFLNEYGYKTQIIGSRSTLISLPKLGEKAGVGELSPFNSLVVKGYGLRAVLSAIITDAPLRQSSPVTDACIGRDTCFKKCPALIDGKFDRKKCTSCGACVKKCPV